MMKMFENLVNCAQSFQEICFDVGEHSHVEFQASIILFDISDISFDASEHSHILNLITSVLALVKTVII
jgi:hypothetical protein